MLQSAVEEIKQPGTGDVVGTGLGDIKLRLEQITALLPAQRISFLLSMAVTGLGLQHDPSFCDTTVTGNADHPLN
jgi:hypothetical protein